MRRAFYVRVAIHAGKHAAVDGIFKRLRVDVQANNLAIHFMRKRSIAVAGEAFVCCGFGRVFFGRSVQGTRC
jgi:hypothetical protein